MLLNLTPHIVSIFNENGKLVTELQPSGMVARCGQSVSKAFTIDDVTVYKTVFGEVIDLPTPVDDTYLIVSRLVASALPERKDLLVPGSLKRNSDGQPIGCVGLSLP